MIRWIVFVVIVLFVDFYAFQSIKTLTKNKMVWTGYWLLSIGVIANFIYQLNTYDGSKGLSAAVMLAFGLVILSFVPKVFALIFMLGEDLVRIGKLGVNYFTRDSEKALSLGRRDFVSKLALGVAAIPFASVIYGMVRGKYDYQVINHTLYFDDLPSAFDGYKLTHISDIHSGSFDNAERIAYGIDLINEQGSDVILFTGDIVNNRAEEMDPWIDHFSKLHASDGEIFGIGKS